MPSISIVLPIHNQEDHVEQVVRQYAAALTAHDVKSEIVLVPNGCTDNSTRICRQLGEELSEIQVVELVEGGWGRAVRAGLAAAHGDVLAYTNAARTSPEILMLLVVYARIYPSVVLKANRRVRDNLVRRMGSLLYNLECRALFDVPYWDINGTPKVFPRSFGKLLELTQDNDLIDAEFYYVCQREEYPVVEIPVLSTVRHGGQSTTSLRSAARMYSGAYLLARRSRRAA